jgi:predicted TPR repeat methyltransferase
VDIAAKCTTHSGCGLKQNNNDGIEINANGETDMALYDNLLVLDLEEMTVENTLGSMDAFRNTNEEQGGFDLIVAADVLVYFGNLETLLAIFAKVSRPGASLVFSCERATQDEAPLGWRLLSSGRFAHTKLHAVETASQFGYELLSYQEIVPRMEKGEEVRGHLFGFRLATTMRHPTAEGQHKNGEL